MIRFQCPHCSGIIASETWEPGAATECAYCSKPVNMPSERLAPGMMLGDFLIIRKHGAGGMGIVYFAHQLSLDRPAAIKVLNAEFAKDTESVKAFIREARSAAKLNHPNIVQAYAVGEEDGIFYFAMEFIDGKTMKEVLQEEKKLDPRRAATVIMHAANALDCAWREQKIIHRDIKPDNIMQCKNDRIKLADLGLSGVFGDDANDESEEVVGTPQYISPEQLTGVVTDTRSDIYSLGATFYHLITGQFPYNGENTDEIARQHVYGTLTPPKSVDSNIPQKLNDIIVKMMAKKPEERYQNCADLAKDLKSFLDNSNQPAAGLSGSKLGSAPAVGVQPKLGGGLSGAGAQPKIIVPASGNKLSLKIAGQKNEPTPEEKSEKPAAEAPAAEAPAPAVKPTIKLGAKPAVSENESTLNLAMNQKRSEAEPEKPAPIKLKVAPAAAPEPAPEPEVAEEAAAPEASVQEPTAETVETADAAENAAADQTPAEAVAAAEVPAEEIAVDTADNAEAENSETETPEVRKKFSKLWLILTIIVLVLAAGGGAAWYFLFAQQDKKAPVKPAVEVKTPAKPAAEPVKKVEVEPAPVIAPVMTTPNTPIYKTPEAKVEKVSPFMREASKLEDLYLTNEASFVQTWKQRYNKLKPANAAEKKFYNSLEESFITADERVYVTPSRQPLIKAYEAQVALIARQQAAKEYRERIANAEKEALAFSEASAENYAADLPRKMGLLDHAMITAARSGRPADWQRFEKALELAKAEPQRVAARTGFAQAAEKLAKYAKRLEVVAEQGKFISDLLIKNKLKGKVIEQEKSTITVTSTNRSMIVLLEKFKPQEVKPKAKAPVKPKAVSTAKAKGKAPAKGKAAAKAPAKKKAPAKAKAKAKPKMVTPRPKTHKISLFDKNVQKVRDFMKIVETPLGRSDQYFYYMLYNGNLQNDLSEIAPDKFWQKQVNQLAKRYFARVLFLATDQQLPQLKKSYGSWPAFKEALEDFEKKH